jgi:hypothetical protein
MTVSTLTGWFAFKAYNAQTQYGYGTEQEASLYEDELNKGRTYYHAYPMTRDQVADLKLADNDLGFSLSIALADAEETR